jgi:hypothetical protein
VLATALLTSALDPAAASAAAAAADDDAAAAVASAAAAAAAAASWGLSGGSPGVGGMLLLAEPGVGETLSIAGVGGMLQGSKNSTTAGIRG